MTRLDKAIQDLQEKSFVGEMDLSYKAYNSNSDRIKGDKKIGDEDVDRLAEALSKNNGNITHIDLSCNNITDKGLKVLLPVLKKITTLKYINFELQQARQCEHGGSKGIINEQ